jgi:hypothetical protein
LCTFSTVFSPVTGNAFGQDEQDEQDETESANNKETVSANEGFHPRINAN